MGEGSEETAIDAIHAAEREDTWLVIDQLHLTSDSFFKQLGYHLHRIAKSKSRFLRNPIAIFNAELQVGEPQFICVALLYGY